MSYSKDLDEYSEDELLAELEQRKDLRSTGLCDYCAQPGYTPSCKFPFRHVVATAFYQRKLRADAGIIEVGTTIVGPR